MSSLWEPLSWLLLVPSWHLHWQDLAVEQSPCANWLFLALHNYSATLQNSISTVYFYFKLAIEKLALCFFLSLEELIRTWGISFTDYQLNTPPFSARPPVCSRWHSRCQRGTRYLPRGKMPPNGDLSFTQSSRSSSLHPQGHQPTHTSMESCQPGSLSPMFALQFYSLQSILTSLHVMSKTSLKDRQSRCSH